MTFIEGVGDEVTAFFATMVVVAIAAIVTFIRRQLALFRQYAVAIPNESVSQELETENCDEIETVQETEQGDSSSDDSDNESENPPADGQCTDRCVDNESETDHHINDLEHLLGDPFVEHDTICDETKTHGEHVHIDNDSDHIAHAEQDDDDDAHTEDGDDVHTENDDDDGTRSEYSQSEVHEDIETRSENSHSEIQTEHDDDEEEEEGDETHSEEQSEQDDGDDETHSEEQSEHDEEEEESSTDDNAHIELENDSEINGHSQRGTNIRVRLKYLDDRERVVVTNPNVLVGEFKRTFFADDLVNGRNVRLIFSGRLLLDSQTLTMCRINHNSVIHVQILSMDRGAPPTRQEGEIDLGGLLWGGVSVMMAASWALYYQYPSHFAPLALTLLFFFTATFFVVTVTTFYRTNTPIEQ